MSDASPLLQITELNKRYGEVPVLNDFSIEVPRGEKLVIIGRSGSGKSTLLRILMTLERPDSGNILIEGEPLWHMPVNGGFAPADARHLQRMRRRIGMVFQHFNLFPHMTALKNISVALSAVTRLPKRDAEARALELLEQVGLADKSESYPVQLSGGQKQRVAIARALAMRPHIMLFDEITSALDPELVNEVLDVLRKLAKETDMTMLLVTHEMRFAREIADRVAFMDRGRVVEIDSPQVLLKTPKYPETKEYLDAFLSP